MRLLSSIIIMLAVGFATSAEAKGKGKPRGHVAGEKKPGKLEKKGKKGGKHDLGAVIDSHKRKGKGKGKPVEGTKEADEAKLANEGAEPAVTAPGPKGKGKGHAWGRSKKFLELRKHLERLAKIKRLEELAKEGKNDKLLTKIQLLRDKENKRHERVVAKVDTKESIKDAKDAVKDTKAAVKDAKAAVKEAKKAE